MNSKHFLLLHIGRKFKQLKLISVSHGVELSAVINEKFIESVKGSSNALVINYYKYVSSWSDDEWLVKSNARITEKGCLASGTRPILQFSEYSLELVFIVKLTITTVPRPFHGCNVHSALPFCFPIKKVFALVPFQQPTVCCSSLILQTFISCTLYQ